MMTTESIITRNGRTDSALTRSASAGPDFATNGEQTATHPFAVNGERAQLAKPRLQKKILPVLFARDDIISQFQQTKLCALPFIVNCYMHLLTIIALHFSIQYYLTAFQMLIYSHCYARNVPAMPTGKGG